MDARPSLISDCLVVSSQSGSRNYPVRAETRPAGRSVPDARAIADHLVEHDVKLSLGRTLFEPDDPMGKLLFNIFDTFAELAAGPIGMRTREGMTVARARGKLRGKQPKLSDRQQRELCRMHATGEYYISDLAKLFSVSRPTVTAHSTVTITLNLRPCPIPGRLVLVRGTGTLMTSRNRTRWLCLGTYCGAGAGQRHQETDSSMRSPYRRKSAVLNVSSRRSPWASMVATMLASWICRPPT